MEKERSQLGLQGQSMFGGFNNGPFGGIKAKAAKSEIEIIRSKMMKRHDVMVKDSNKSKDVKTLAFKQHAIIDHLHTILETYGWSFGD